MMEFLYSELPDPSTYKTEDLCNGIDFRYHKSSASEENGVIRAHDDWSRIVRPVTNYRGCLSERFHFVSASQPECRPERLEVLSYANEVAFLYDGKDITMFPIYHRY